MKLKINDLKKLTATINPGAYVDGATWRTSDIQSTCKNAGAF